MITMMEQDRDGGPYWTAAGDGPSRHIIAAAPSREEARRLWHEAAAEQMQEQEQEQPKTYVTFGQDHTHRLNGKVFDKDCVAVVNGDRARVFDLFGTRFCMEYPEDHWDDAKLRYFPRGLIAVEGQL